MPRPHYDLDTNLPRIVKRLQGPQLADVRSALLAWPATNHALSHSCWIWTGAVSPSPTIRRENQMTTVARYLIELIAGEKLGMTWRVYAKCPNPTCVSPFHHELKPHFINRFDVPDPLPKRLLGTPIQLSTTTNEDVLDLQLDMEDRDIDTYELARGIYLSLNVYTEDEVNAAYDLHAAKHGLKARPLS